MLWVALTLVSSAATTVLNEEQYQKQFTTFISDYGKTYSTADMFPRYNIFKANLDAVLEHNSQEGVSYTQGINQFSDLTYEEFEATYLGSFEPEPDMPIPENPKPVSRNQSFDASALPSAWDWCQRGSCTRINTQGCQDCWAQSMVAATETATHIATRRLQDLSVQNVIDCAPANSNQPDRNGCNPWIPAHAGAYAIEQGLCTEAEYPYVGRGGQACNKRNCRSLTFLSSWDREGPTGNIQNREDRFMAQLAVGPIVTTMNFDRTLSAYDGGIYGGGCPQSGQNHAIVIVGYGTEGGVDYWNIRNSWGPRWGENGYVRVRANVNECGLRTSPVIVHV